MPDEGGLLRKNTQNVVFTIKNKKGIRIGDIMKKMKIHEFKCRLVIMLTMCFMMGGFFSIHSQAAEYSVSPLAAVLISGNGAEVFAQPDPATLVTILPGDVPVQITGVTGNGFYQVVVNENVYYMYAKALSTMAGTQAYTLTSIDAKAALVGNATTGEVIYSMQGDVSLPPASTVKMMTALLTLDAVAQGQLTLDTPLAVSPTAIAGMPGDASHVTPRLQAGESMSVLSLLECVLIESDCYACNVLAEAVAGSVDNFVALMNMRAAGLGCTGTVFVNTSGYPAPGQVATARSLFLVAREALKYPVFEAIVSLNTVDIPATNVTPVRSLHTTDQLITNSIYYNPYAFGIKTGSSNSSGLCFVSGARKDGKTVITVILGANTRLMTDGVRLKQQFAETNKLINIGLASAS